MVGTTPSPSPAQSQETLNGKRALVVQGDVRERQRLIEFLSSWGIDVEVTANPFHGVAMLWRAMEAAQPFDLLLFGTTGHGVISEQFAALVRSEPRLAEIPMLHVGGHLGTDEKLALRRSGFFDAVSTPLDKTWLFDSLHRACGSVAAGDGVARLMDRHAIAGSSVPRLEVLVAEPTAEQRRVVRSILERGGHQIFEVDSGEQALEALATHRFDLVIIALDLPGLGTADALKLYRFSTVRQDWPAFIGLTPEATLSQMRDYADIGVTLVASPAQPRELLRAIVQVIRGDAAARTACPSSLISAAEESSAMSYLDERVLREIERLGSHPNFVYELVQEFLTEIGARIEALIAMRGTAHCHLRLREFGHVLQDNAGNVGALQLYRLGLVASQYSEEMFIQDEGHLLTRIDIAYRQTRAAFWSYLRSRSVANLPGGARE